MLSCHRVARTSSVWTFRSVGSNRGCYSLHSRTWSSSLCSTTRVKIRSSATGVVAGVAPSSSFHDRWHDPHHHDYGSQSSTYAAAAAALLFGITAATTITTTATTPSSICHCEASASSSSPTTNVGVTPSAVAKEDFEAYQQTHDIDKMPEYTLEEMRERNGEDGKPIWMSYGGVIYDVTDFIPNHPGGSEKIMQAAGTAIEPFWYLYRQHFASDLPMKLMEHLAVGRLAEVDQQQIDEQMAVLEQDDPYAREPHRHPNLRVHSDTPMNAEVPTRYLTQSYLTPNHLFYIRHHHPVPFFSEKQLHNYTIQIDLSACSNSSSNPNNNSDDNNKQKPQKIVKITLEELKKMPSTKIIATLQCSGNRRGGFNAFQRTSGTPWGQGAISTAEFKGVLLKDLLEYAGFHDPWKTEPHLEHVRFYSADGMQASVSMEKAMSPYGDVLVAYEQNGEPIPRDHGLPVRVIVPGYAAVRSVKWLEKIEVSTEEAEGPWQRGLNYKPLPPAVTDANKVDLSTMPSVTELSLYSGITTIEKRSTGPLNPGDRCLVKVGGWAFAGGGRNIVRVDVTGDRGGTWATAKLKEGANQPFHRAWAWVFWECELPVVVQEDGTAHVSSRAVDMAFNAQPENSNHLWNVRGLGNNSWYRAHAKVME